VLDNVGLLHVLLDDVDQVDDSAISNDIVPVSSTVAGNISDRPNCLFDGAEVLASQQFNEERNAALVDDGLALNGGS
jgi:hypothetical protein